jgi:pilus assembly protein CpaB
MKLALKVPQFNRSWLMLVGAVALGGVALVLSHKVLNDHMAQLDAEERAAHTMVKVVVAGRDLTRGEPITADRFAIREVPIEYAHAAAVRPDHFQRYIGARLASNLKKGESLLDVHLESLTQVFSATLENGNRALTTEVDEVNSISGMLRPADHIDLLATARGTGKDAQELTFELLSNVQVLATGQVTRKRDDNQAHTYTTITLSVSPQDAQRIIVAKSSGKLTAVLRNPDDARRNATSAMNINDLMPKKAGDAKRAAVQYIVGNHS